jgi:ankyrin repeat protein
MKYVILLVLTILLIAFAASRRAGEPTALAAWLAIERGDAQELRSLLERGLDPDAAFSELTLLMHAANQRDSGCVGVLVRMGAEVDRAADCNGATALTWAAWNGTAASVRCLLDAGADVNVRMIQGWTPLTLAAMSGDEEKVTALLAAGADVHAQTAAGLRAAEIAESRGHGRVAGLLSRAAGVATRQSGDAEPQ